MNIADLFVSLKITDADKTIASLKDVQKTLQGMQNFKMPHMMPIKPLQQMPHMFPIKQAGEEQQQANHPFWSSFKKHLVDAKKGLSNFFKVKPSEKTPKALEQVESGLKNIGSMSLEAKAGIVATIYAIDRLFEMSGRQGTSALNTATLLSGNTETLQRYEFVATKAGSSNEELASTFLSLSDAMAKLTTTGVAPTFWGQLQRVVGKFSAEDVEDFTAHPEKLFQRLQTYSQIEKNLGVKKQVLQSLLTQTMTALVMRNKFTPEALAAAPVYTDAQIRKLDQSRSSWADVSERFGKMFGHLNIQFGKEFAQNVKQIIPDLERLVNAFVHLSESLHAMELLDKVFKGWGLLFDAMADSVDVIVKGWQLLKQSGKDLKNEGLMMPPSHKGGSPINIHAPDFGGPSWKEIMDEYKNKKSNIPPLPLNVHPIGKTGSINHYHIKQNLHFLTREHDKHEMAAIMQREITNALGNYPLVENS
jgi:hypothetical protein